MKIPTWLFSGARWALRLFALGSLIFGALVFPYAPFPNILAPQNQSIRSFETTVNVPLPFPFNNTQQEAVTVIFTTSAELIEGANVTLNVVVNFTSPAVTGLLNLKGVTVKPTNAFETPLHLGVVVSESVATGSVCAPAVVCVEASGIPEFSVIPLEPIVNPVNTTWGGSQNVEFSSSGTYGAEVDLNTPTVYHFGNQSVSVPKTTIIDAPPIMEVHSTSEVFAQQNALVETSLTLFILSFASYEISKGDRGETDYEKANKHIAEDYD